jgi:gluconolactonase
LSRIAFNSIVTKESALERIASGFQFTEGPVWNSLEDCLLFSDIPANCIYKWSHQEGVTVFKEPSGNSNGLTYDEKGNLIVCEHSNRRISRFEKKGGYSVLADRFQGKRFNSPNDITVKSNGLIYFTDPPYGIPPHGEPADRELPFQGVFLLDPANNELTLLVDDFDRPNGLAFSPDESIIYIADSSDRKHVRVFDVDYNGVLRKSRIFAEVKSDLPGPPDGMKVDVDGNLYVASAGGVWVYAEDGKHLGIIKTPEIPTNCAWGEGDWRSLFITAGTSVYRIRLGIPGVKTPENR